MNNPCVNCVEQTSDCQNDCASFSEYTSEKLHEILTLCLEAKKKGHDCFFDYYPHAECVDVRIYIKGWRKNEDPDKSYSIFGFIGDRLEEIITYLKGLIK